MEYKRITMDKNELELIIKEGEGNVFLREIVSVVLTQTGN